MTKSNNNNSKYLVFGGIALLVLAVLAFAPQVFPVLIFLACPLMMLFMMGSGMHGHGHSGGMQQPQYSSHQHEEGRQSILPPGANPPLTQEEQLAELKLQLYQLQCQQEGLAQEIRRLEGDHLTSSR